MPHHEQPAGSVCHTDACLETLPVYQHLHNLLLLLLLLSSGQVWASCVMAVRAGRV
jgi:hypothetical protein